MSLLATLIFTSKSENRIRFSDFDVMINVAKSDIFKRERQDIYVEFPLSITTAVLGGVVTVPSLDGGGVQIKVKPGTQPNSALRLAGKGLPYPNSKRRGDEYVIFKVKIPEKVTGRQKQILEELDA